jgi:hypothetical protein
MEKRFTRTESEEIEAEANNRQEWTSVLKEAEVLGRRTKQ